MYENFELNISNNIEVLSDLMDNKLINKIFEVLLAVTG
jgi:hypothetical protein